MSDTRLSQPQVRPNRLVLAAAATIVLVALFWIFEPSLLWMGGILAAGIWMPLATRHEESASRWALPALAGGITVLSLIGLVVWIA
ncbi:MAG: hypothetical protein V3R84_09145 [Acidimicrobiia bacterium]